MIEVWKILHGKEDVDPGIWFVMAGADATHITRQVGHPLNIVKPRARLEFRKNFFSLRCCDSWNSLPVGMRDAKSVKPFKNGYDKHLLNNSSRHANN